MSTLAFILVLGNFFSVRIRGELSRPFRDKKLSVTDEERHLVRFFGNEYIQYRKRVGTGLPFIISDA